MTAIVILILRLTPFNSAYTIFSNSSANYRDRVILRHAAAQLCDVISRYINDWLNKQRKVTNLG